MANNAKHAGLSEAQRDRCWEHYIRGWRPGEIARELNISELSVRNALKAAQDAARARRSELAADYLQRELDHLDALEKALERDVDALPDDAGETDAKILRAKLAAANDAKAKAVKLIIEIKARRAKYLGLDKPSEVKHSLTLEDLVAGE